MSWTPVPNKRSIAPTASFGRQKATYHSPRKPQRLLRGETVLGTLCVRPHVALQISVACLQIHRPFIFQSPPSYTTSRRRQHPNPQCYLLPLSLSAVVGQSKRMKTGTTTYRNDRGGSPSLFQRHHHIESHGRLYSNPPTRSSFMSGSGRNALPTSTHVESHWVQEPLARGKLEAEMVALLSGALAATTTPATTSPTTGTTINLVGWSIAGTCVFLM